LFLKTNGITVFQTHVDANYGLIVKKIEKEVNNNLKFHHKNNMQRKACNESNVISNFFGAIDIYKKYNMN